MKLRTLQSSKRGFTLTETLTACAVSALLFIGFMYTQIFLLRYDEMTCSKLGASDNARKGFDMLLQDIRSSKKWEVGNGNLHSFSPIAAGNNQQGTALQLHLSTDTNIYIRYYLDTSTSKLCRIHSGDITPRVIAESLTNTVIFTSEDYRGAIVSDYSYKNVIHTKLQFYQYQYPLTKVGPNYFYNYYCLDFRATPHCPDSE
jgi:hypothetical protein